MSLQEPTRIRSDARRNREKLVATATEAFASGQTRVSLDSIARAAGVGIGTLYRHFPTREDLVEAVYDDQLGRLHLGAAQLLRDHPPLAALRLWADLFADWAVTKHGMVDTLRAIVASGRVGSSEMRGRLEEIVDTFLVAGAAAGDLRCDVSAADLAAVLAGILSVSGAPDRRDQCNRMLNLVIDGLRPSAAGGLSNP